MAFAHNTLAQSVLYLCYKGGEPGTVPTAMGNTSQQRRPTLAPYPFYAGKLVAVGHAAEQDGIELLYFVHGKAKKQYMSPIEQIVCHWQQEKQKDE